MPYIRVSLMKPFAGREAEVADLNAELVDFYRRQEGCLQCHLVRALDGSGEIGRVSAWESEAAADRAATRSMALRARLHLLIRKGHQDRSFLAE